MKKALIFSALVVALASCGNNSEGSSNADSITSISADTARGGADTTGLNVGAAQPVDPNNRLRQADTTEPGAKKSGVYDSIDTTNGGQRGGGQ